MVMKEEHTKSDFSNEINKELIKCEFVTMCRLRFSTESNQVKSWCNDIKSLDKSSSYCIIR